jgi:transcriptional regulator with XRE-family HTH domain
MRQSVQVSNGRLRSHRLRAGLSRRELARLAGVSSSTIDRAEGGAIPWPEQQHKIACVLTDRLGEAITTLDLWPLVEDAA